MPSSLQFDYYQCHDALLERLKEAAPGLIQLLTGPRQVGKTTLLLEIAESFGDMALYAAADSPESAAPGFWERLWLRAEETAAQKGKCILLLDEAHLFADWSARLKGSWDSIRRRKLPIHVVATGSSALRIGSGSRESLAGRFEKITLAHWSAASLARAFGLSQNKAAETAVTHGSYPGAFAFIGRPERWAAYVRDAIVEPAIGRDILALAAVRKPALLRQVFGVCTSAPAQIVSLQKLQGQLQDKGALETVAQYLRLLEDAYLIAALPKHSTRQARQRSSPPKLVTLNNALLAVADPRGAPKAATDPARFGAWLENACLAHAYNSGQTVTYWRQEPYEVDGIFQGSWGKWAVEIKSGPVAGAGLAGLFEFTRRHPEYKPLVICDAARAPAARNLGVDAVAWQDFLISGPNPPAS